MFDYVKVASMGDSSIAVFHKYVPAADPLVEVMSNKDHFTGRPIYDEGTKYNKITPPQSMNMNNTAEWPSSSLNS